MARRKSVNDLRQQLEGLFNYSTYSNDRAIRASAAYRRYRLNIQRALGYSNRGRGIGALNARNQTFSNPRFQSVAAINAERVPRNVYMGLNNG